MSLLCVQFYHNSITTHNIKDYLKHIFLESNVLYANSNSGSMLEMQQVSAEWLGKSAHSYRKSFWGGEKKWSKKQTFPHGNVLWKKCRCCHAGVHVKRNISPGSHERKGERGGDSGVRDPRAGKKSRGWWQKDLNSCTMCLSDVFTFNLQVKFKQQPKPTDQHIFSTKLK